MGIGALRIASSPFIEFRGRSSWAASRAPGRGVSPVGVIWPLAYPRTAAPLANRMRFSHPWVLGQ